MAKESAQRASKNKAASSELLDALAGNIKRIRKQQGVSQERLAEKANMHRTFISLLERSGRNPTLGVIEAIAVALGVEVADLVTLPGEAE